MNGARYILEALRVCEAQWSTTAKASDDEDLQADYGNDIARLSIAYDGFEKAAVAAFGEGKKEFSREPIPVTPPKASGF